MAKKKILVAAFVLTAVLVLLCSSSSIKTVSASTASLYLDSGGPKTVYGHSGLTLSGSTDYAQTQIEGDSPDSGQITFGCEIYLLHSGGSVTEITSGESATASFDTQEVFQGVISGTWTCPGLSVATSDAVEVIVECDAGTAVFISDPLGVQYLDAGTWTVDYSIWQHLPQTTWIYEFVAGAGDSVVSFGYNDVPITVTSSPTGLGYVTVDGSAITTPHTFIWAIGGSHTITASSPVSGGSGIQYAFSSWSDSGAQSHTYTVPGASDTVTANYQTQYYLTVSSTYGSTSGSGWYNAGSVAYASVSAGTVSTGTGSQEVFSSWSTGGTNYAGSNGITMNSPVTSTASWQGQYYLTVSSSHGSPTGQGWYNSGASASFSVSTPISGGAGTQYAFSSWAGSGSGSYSGASASASCTMNGPITKPFLGKPNAT